MEHKICKKISDILKLSGCFRENCYVFTQEYYDIYIGDKEDEYTRSDIISINAEQYKQIKKLIGDFKIEFWQEYDGMAYESTVNLKIIPKKKSDKLCQ